MEESIQKETFSQTRTLLKFEDKILLGIAGIFLIGMVFFVIFAGKMFESLENKAASENTPLPHKVEKDPMKEFDEIFEKSFKEGRESFERVQKTLDDNRRKRQEDFKKIEENFKTRFKKARKNLK